MRCRSFRRCRWRARSPRARRRRRGGASARSRAGRAATGRRCRAASRRSAARPLVSISTRQPAGAGAVLAHDDELGLHRDGRIGQRTQRGQRRRIHVGRLLREQQQHEGVAGVLSSQPSFPRRAPAHRPAARPGAIVPAKTSPSGVLSADSLRCEGTDSRPEFTRPRAKPCSRASVSTALRKSLETWLWA